MPSLTILTPAYNRAHLLPRLYNSLCGQTSKDFEWLVVDDGSTDGTENLVQTWKGENKIIIKYVKKENGGKISALIEGAKHINSELVFLCDSDDYPTDDAVETIFFYREKYQNCKEKICGFTFHRADKNGNISGGNFPEKEMFEHYHIYQINKWDGYFGKETAQVFFTEIFREFLPKKKYFGKRNYITDDIIWLPMGFEYKTVFIDMVLQIYEYLADGITKSRNINKSRNVKAQYERSLYLMHPEIKLKIRLRGALMANVYGRFCNLKVPRTLLTLVTYLPALAVYKIWKRKYGMGDEVC